MVDTVMTPASIIAGSDAQIEHGKFGGTIVAGQVVYKDSADGKYKLADADGASVAIKTAYGIALNGGADGQPGTVIRSGDLTVGAVLTAGARYYLSGGAGGVQPEADLATPEYVVLLGIAKSTTVLQMRIQIPGVTL